MIYSVTKTNVITDFSYQLKRSTLKRLPAFKLVQTPAITPMLEEFLKNNPIMEISAITVTSYTQLFGEQAKDFGVEAKILLDKINYPNRYKLEDAFSNFPSADKDAIRREIWKCLATGKTELSLTKLFPDHVQKITMKKPTGELPTFANCRNASIIWHSRWMEHGPTDTYEFREYLSEYFSKLSQGQELSTGDIIVWRGKNEFTSWIDHTAIYLTNNLVWHKQGFGQSPWVIETLEHIDLLYQDKNKCPLNHEYMTVHRVKQEQSRICRYGYKYRI